MALCLQVVRHLEHDYVICEQHNAKAGQPNLDLTSAYWVGAPV